MKERLTGHPLCVAATHLVDTSGPLCGKRVNAIYVTNMTQHFFSEGGEVCSNRRVPWYARRVKMHITQTS